MSGENFLVTVLVVVPVAVTVIVGVRDHQKERRDRRRFSLTKPSRGSSASSHAVGRRLQ